MLPGGYRKALRPLQKTTMFQAVEDEYGVGEARGTQFGYFTLMLAGTMLATAVLATVVVRVAPDSYSDAAPLIPLIAGGLVAPTVYRMLNKSVKYADKRVPFIAGAVVAMLLFIGLALLLIPELGVEGAPLAMMAAFLPPSLYIYWRSQRGRSPIRMPWRSMLLSCGLAVAIAWLHGRLDLGDSIVVEALAGMAAIAVWAVLCLVTGAVPAAHRMPLVAMLRGLRDRGSHGFEADAGLETLNPRERRALRRAIVRGLPPETCRSPGPRRREGATDREPTPRTPPLSCCCAVRPRVAAPPGSRRATRAAAGGRGTGLATLGSAPSSSPRGRSRSATSSASG